MWGQYLVRGEKEIVEEFRQLFEPQLAAAVQMLEGNPQPAALPAPAAPSAAGEPSPQPQPQPTNRLKAMHHHHYNARMALFRLMEEVELFQANRSPEARGAPTLLNFVVSLAACKLLVLVGRTYYDAMETKEGYNFVDAATRFLETMEATRQPLALVDVAQAREALLSNEKRTVARPPTLMKATDRQSLVGCGLLLECYVFMAMAWSRWGDNERAMACLQSTEALRERWEAGRDRRYQARKAMAVDQLRNERDSQAATRAGHEAQNEASQRAAYLKKLEARRAKAPGGGASKSDGGGGPESSSAEVTGGGGNGGSDASQLDPSPRSGQEGATTGDTAQQASPPAAGRAGSTPYALPALPWCLLGAVADSAVALREDLHDFGLEDATAVQRLLGDATTCLAQVCKAENKLNDVCYYSHRTLQRRLVTGDPVEWAWACLNLTEYYLAVRDLSHAEHCLAAALHVLSNHELQEQKHAPAPAGAVVAASTPATATGGVDSVAQCFQHAAFYDACLSYQLLKLMQVTAEALPDDHEESLDGTSMPMFLNPLLPPEELRNIPEKDRTKPDWCRAERLPFVELPIPPPRTAYVVKDGAAEAIQLYKRLLEAIERSKLTIDTDCERYLIELRMQADACNILFTFFEDPAYALKRLDLLGRVLSAQLNEGSFRNVLQQARFDSGTTAQGLAEAFQAGSADEKTFYEVAHDHFAAFCTTFEKEHEAARKSHAKQDDVFEPTDCPAYALGQLRAAHVALKLRRMDEARRRYVDLVAFLGNNEAMFKSFPELAEQKRLSEELLALLPRDAAGMPSAGVVAETTAAAAARAAKRPAAAVGGSSGGKHAAKMVGGGGGAATAGKKPASVAPKK